MEDKALYKATLNMLTIAHEKGFPYYSRYVDPHESVIWHENTDIYCAHCCAGLMLWLRKTFNIVVSIQDTEAPDCFDSWANFYGYNGFYNEAHKSWHTTYEHQLMATINFALNHLPNGTQP
jgi:hypothetical protein